MKLLIVMPALQYTRESSVVRPMIRRGIRTNQIAGLETPMEKHWPV